MATMVKYNIRSVQSMMAQLQEWIDSSQDTLNNEESKDYPNDDRVTMLTDRIDALQNAYDALEGIE